MKKFTVLSVFVLGAIIAKSQSTTYTSGVNTWTAPKAVTSITVQCWGGGGAGGYGETDLEFWGDLPFGVGAGGGGGGFSEGDAVQVIPGTGYVASVAAVSTGNG